MKSKEDIQLELLQEIDTICSQNNLNYILFGVNSLNVYLNHEINSSRVVAVAMTHGDIDRFCDIIEREYGENRYVEGLFNNPDYFPFNVSYGNKNTTDFHIISINKNIHHGIHVLIFPIRRLCSHDGKQIPGWTPRLRKERKLRKFLKKRIENDKFWYMKLGFGALNKAYSLTGGGTRYYNDVKKNTFIDKWEDIQNYSAVQISNKKISSKHFKETSRYEVMGIQIRLPKDAVSYFSDIYGEDFKEINIRTRKDRKRAIVDTEIGYEKIMEETADILKEARSVHEEIVWERRKVRDEKDSVNNVWNLVKMTKKQIEYIDYFDENRDRLLSFDLDDKVQFKELYEEVEPMIFTFKKFANRGMTFSINPEADELIKSVLLKSGEGDLVKQIDELSKKEYFVE